MMLGAAQLATQQAQLGTVPQVVVPPGGSGGVLYAGLGQKKTFSAEGELGGGGW